ncbi:MAG: hypothetical protein DME88_00890 [Verrucomicrobia bacterium]|nr:MAG: hypothetical protein DME88_00890 [Verrucomicrobiota bacterium]
MKPITLTARNRRTFPLVECNYQPMRLNGYQGRCARIEAPSFRNISRQYFQKEARPDFIGEALLFAIMIVLAAAPLLSTASAFSEFCRAIAPL